MAVTDGFSAELERRLRGNSFPLIGAVQVSSIEQALLEKLTTPILGRIARESAVVPPDMAAAVVVSLAHFARHAYASGALWPKLQTRLGPSARLDGQGQARIGRLFAELGERFGYRMPRSPRTYVGPMLLHAGVPNESVRGLVALLEDGLAELGPDALTEIETDQVQALADRASGLHRELARCLTESSFGVDVVRSLARAFLAIRETGQHEELVLPVAIDLFSEEIHRVAKAAATTIDPRHRALVRGRPRLEWSLGWQTVVLALPAVETIEGTSDVTWWIDGIAAAPAGTPTSLVARTPTSSIQVRLLRGGACEHTWTVDGGESHEPSLPLVFAPGGARIEPGTLSETGMPPGRWTVLCPNGMTPEINLVRRRFETDWPNFSGFEIDIEAKADENRSRIVFAGSDGNLELPINRFNGGTVAVEGEPIAFALDSAAAQVPIFTKPPRIHAVGARQDQEIMLRREGRFRSSAAPVLSSLPQSNTALPALDAWTYQLAVGPGASITRFAIWPGAEYRPPSVSLSREIEDATALAFADSSFEVRVDGVACDPETKTPPYRWSILGDLSVRPRAKDRELGPPLWIAQPIVSLGAAVGTESLAPSMRRLSLPRIVSGREPLSGRWLHVAGPPTQAFVAGGERRAFDRHGRAALEIAPLLGEGDAISVEIHGRTFEVFFVDRSRELTDVEATCTRDQVHLTWKGRTMPRRLCVQGIDLVRPWARTEAIAIESPASGASELPLSRLLPNGGAQKLGVRLLIPKSRVGGLSQFTEPARMVGGGEAVREVRGLSPTGLMDEPDPTRRALTDALRAAFENKPYALTERLAENRNRDSRSMIAFVEALSSGAYPDRALFATHKATVSRFLSWTDHVIEVSRDAKTEPSGAALDRLFKVGINPLWLREPQLLPLPGEDAWSLHDAVGVRRDIGVLTHGSGLREHAALLPELRASARRLVRRGAPLLPVRFLGALLPFRPGALFSVDRKPWFLESWTGSFEEDDTERWLCGTGCGGEVGLELLDKEGRAGISLVFTEGQWRQRAATSLQAAAVSCSSREQTLGILRSELDSALIDALKRIPDEPPIACIFEDSGMAPRGTRSVSDWAEERLQVGRIGQFAAFTKIIRRHGPLRNAWSLALLASIPPACKEVDLFSGPLAPVAPSPDLPTQKHWFFEKLLVALRNAPSTMALAVELAAVLWMVEGGHSFAGALLPADPRPGHSSARQPRR